MGKSAIFRATTVHHSEHKGVFAWRLEEPTAFTMLGDLAGGPVQYNMRTLATAIRMLVEDQSCKRIMVGVAERTIVEAGEQYASLLMTIPAELREKLFIEIGLDGVGVSQRCADFSLAVQEECGMSVMAWARCNDLAHVEEVAEALSPAVIGVTTKCLKSAMAREDRMFIIDAVEAASAAGARVLVAGIETAEERESMLEIGVDLLCGSMMSSVKDVQEGFYEQESSLMKSFERRKHRTSGLLHA